MSSSWDLFLVVALFQQFDTSTSSSCFNCHQTTKCIYSVGILKFTTENEKAVLDCAINFIKKMEMLPSTLHFRLR